MAEALKQELHIRLGLLNNGLDDHEYMTLAKIEKLVKAYTDEATTGDGEA